MDAYRDLPIDKVSVRYYPKPQSEKEARKFFLEHEKNYTHLIIYSNDIVVKKEHIIKMLIDLENYPFLDVISGIMPVDSENENDVIAATYDLPSLDWPRVFHWIPRKYISGIQRVRHTGLSLTAIKRDIVEFVSMDGINCLEGANKTKGVDDRDTDLFFSTALYKANIPQYVDCDIEMEHLRYKGEMLVGKKEPQLEFTEWKNLALTI